MSVTASTPGGCPTCGQPTETPIKAPVGTGGKNINSDVKIIQQMLNALKPIEGGPNVMLAEDGLIGPKTQAAITKYQKKALGWTDGRIDVAGPTIKALMGYIIDSPTVPYGKLGAPASSSPSAGTPGGSAPSSTLGADSIAVAHVCLRVMEPRLHTLRWKLTRATPAMMGLLNKHFSTGKDQFVNGDIAQVQKILSDVHFYLARFNAFGIMPVENVILYDPAPAGQVIARTVRGGAKMSTKQVQIYVDKGVVSKNPGQSIWLTSLFADQPAHEKHWTVLHEFCHFVGDRDGYFTNVDDYGYAFESNFLTMNKFKKLHNAESLSLFFLEYCIGTQALSGLPRLKTVKAHFDAFPKVVQGGDLVMS